MNRIVPATGRITRYRHDPNNLASLSDDGVDAVYVDRDGVLRWSHVEADGRRVSSMPDFDSMTKEEVANVVAYLVTLGGEPPGGRNQP